VLKILICILNSYKMEGFSPKFCIFGRKFSAKKIFLTISDSQKFRGGGAIALCPLPLFTAVLLNIILHTRSKTAQSTGWVQCCGVEHNVVKFLFQISSTTFRTGTCRRTTEYKTCCFLFGFMRQNIRCSMTVIIQVCQ